MYHFHLMAQRSLRQLDTTSIYGMWQRKRSLLHSHIQILLGLYHFHLMAQRSLLELVMVRLNCGIRQD